MAYAAGLFSLEQTIRHLRASYLGFYSSHNISLDLKPSEETLLLSFDAVLDFFKELFPRLGRYSESDKKEIEEAACKTEDEIETHLSNQFLSQYESRGGIGKAPSKVSLDFEEVIQAMYSFTDMVEKKKMEETHENDFSNQFLSQSDDESLGSMTFPDHLLQGLPSRYGSSETDSLDPDREEDDIVSSETDYPDPGHEEDDKVSSETDYPDPCREEDNNVSSETDSPDPGRKEDDNVSLETDYSEYSHYRLLLGDYTWPITDYVEPLCSRLPEEEDVVSSTTDFDGKRSKLVGLSKDFNKIKDLLTKPFSVGRIGGIGQIVSLVGMAGIGKTTLAREIYEDPSIASHFEARVFVTIGQQFDFGQVLLNILGQMYHVINNDIHMLETWKLSTLFMGRRWLIVVDDLWVTGYSDYWNSFRALASVLLTASTNNESRILLTTRQREVAENTRVHEMSFLNKEESWNLLCEKVFGEDKSCPTELKKAGQKIAEKCEGLPLTIITVARLMSEAADMTPEFWNMVAEKKNNSIFTNAYDEMLEVLSRSYNYLRQQLKVCFLYMGVFPQNCKIPTSKLINLWGAERLLRLQSYDSEKQIGVECLDELVSNTVVICHKKTSWLDRTKICSLHSVFWYFCVREAKNEKLYHVVDSYAENMKGQLRRFCIYNNVLFGITEVRNSMESVSMARSLLCTGPYHKYPVPRCLDLRLLRILEALTIRFFEFPIELIKLVQLRYLAITSNGNLPASISRLWNLEYLIVERHLSIRSSTRAPSYLPMEIWDMKELKHLQVMGSDLPEPPEPNYDDNLNLFLLPNLKTLLGVSSHTCSFKILKNFRKLEKLGILIELAPDVAESLRFFDQLWILRGLESFKCVIVNSNLVSQVVAFPLHSCSIFPKFLTKLSLSGSGYCGKYMRIIAQLSDLRVLKLRSYAFEELEWKINGGEFKELKYLLLEDCDLVHWIVDDTSSCFIALEHLIIRHCYKLNEIPLAIGDISYLEEIELVDCPLAVASAKKIQERQPDRKNEAIKVSIHSSWLEKLSRKIA